MARRKKEEKTYPDFWRAKSGWCLSGQYELCPAAFPNGECTHDYHANPEKYQVASGLGQQDAVRKVRTRRKKS